MTNFNYFYRLQLADALKGVNINDTGAVAFVCLSGTPTLATLLDQYGNSLANPVQLTSGLLNFQVAESNASGPAAVDIYGMTAGGYWFDYKGVSPSGSNEIFVDTSLKRMRMKIPFAIGNTGPAGACVAATEFKIGLSLPAAGLVMLDRLHGLGVLWTTLQSGKTLSFGVLSTDTGGVAAGFINASAQPTAPSQFVIGTNGSLFSTNAPYASDSETGSAANGLDLSLTLSSGTTTGAGFILAPYELY